MGKVGSGSVTLEVEDREGIRLLRQALDSAHFDIAHIRPMLRADSDSLTPRADDIPIVVRLLPKGDRLASLIRLFVMGLSVSEADASAALAPVSVERALRLGVVRPSTAGVESTVRIRPAGDLLMACDRAHEGSPDLPADHVMAVASSSMFLASLTVRRHVERALDVGCGGGIQSVVAARHADRVIACDINPRALNFTAFNALLNGVDNVECRAGSFFAPVDGEKFDLIVSNPPFVISPDSASSFRRNTDSIRFCVAVARASRFRAPSCGSSRACASPRPSTPSPRTCYRTWTDGHLAKPSAKPRSNSPPVTSLTRNSNQPRWNWPS